MIFWGQDFFDRMKQSSEIGSLGGLGAVGRDVGPEAFIDSSC